jgi:hypothetical protein
MLMVVLGEGAHVALLIPRGDAGLGSTIRSTVRISVSAARPATDGLNLRAPTTLMSGSIELLWSFGFGGVYHFAHQSVGLTAHGNEQGGACQWIRWVDRTGDLTLPIADDTAPRDQHDGIVRMPDEIADAVVDPSASRLRVKLSEDRAIGRDPAETHPPPKETDLQVAVR